MTTEFARVLSRLPRLQPGNARARSVAQRKVPASTLPEGVSIVEVAKVERLLRGEGLACHFQPVWSVREGRAVGFEALSRPFGPSAIAPDRMFEVAAAMGRGVELELVAIAAALKALPSLPRECYLSLNLSPATLLAGELHELLDDCPSFERLMVEITEHELVSDYGRVRDAISPYRQQGLCLATDDAGAGHANLCHILELNPDVLKLDRYIVRGIDKDRRRRAMVRAFKQFADDTRTTMIAEGVETEDELDVLRDLGVDRIQGYLISPAIPLTEAAEMGRTSQSRS